MVPGKPGAIKGLKAAATEKKDYTENCVILADQPEGTMYYKVRAVTKIGSQEYLGKASVISVAVD